MSGVETEVAFFEVGGSEASLELPGGTLARGQGPYQAQLVLESGPVDQPKLTAPSVSLPFWALSEPPAAVVGLTLAEVLPDSFTVEWNAPEDDGGQPIEAYEVQLLHSSKEEAVPAERTEVELAQDKGHLIVLCSTTRQRFAGLQPGSGPHHVQVRARNGARRLGPEQTLQVYTSCLAPAPPTQLRARLLPGWARSQVCGVLHSEGADPDVDVVKLEFLAPVEDGGRPIQAGR
ncbi:unnamed protein product [Effrenium voratum]|nr:unnamed protein product [Effrenium voratum]